MKQRKNEKTRSQLACTSFLLTLAIYPLSFWLWKSRRSGGGSSVGIVVCGCVAVQCFSFSALFSSLLLSVCRPAAANQERKRLRRSMCTSASDFSLHSALDQFRSCDRTASEYFSLHSVHSVPSHSLFTLPSTLLIRARREHTLNILFHFRFVVVFLCLSVCYTCCLVSNYYIF